MSTPTSKIDSSFRLTWSSLPAPLLRLSLSALGYREWIACARAVKSWRQAVRDEDWKPLFQAEFAWAAAPSDAVQKSESFSWKALFRTCFLRTRNIIHGAASVSWAQCELDHRGLGWVQFWAPLGQAMYCRNSVVSVG
jgi:hypothetical protein